MKASSEMEKRLLMRLEIGIETRTDCVAEDTPPR